MQAAAIRNNQPRIRLHLGRLNAGDQEEGNKNEANKKHGGSITQVADEIMARRREWAMGDVQRRGYNAILGRFRI